MANLVIVEQSAQHDPACAETTIYITLAQRPRDCSSHLGRWTRDSRSAASASRTRGTPPRGRAAGCTAGPGRHTAVHGHKAQNWGSGPQCHHTGRGAEPFRRWRPAQPDEHSGPRSRGSRPRRTGTSPDGGTGHSGCSRILLPAAGRRRPAQRHPARRPPAPLLLLIEPVAASPHGGQLAVQGSKVAQTRVRPRGQPARVQPVDFRPRQRGEHRLAARCAIGGDSHTDAQPDAKGMLAFHAIDESDVTPGEHDQVRRLTGIHVESLDRRPRHTSQPGDREGRRQGVGELGPGPGTAGPGPGRQSPDSTARQAIGAPWTEKLRARPRPG